jgi:hypothetical protein
MNGLAGIFDLKQEEKWFFKYLFLQHLFLGFSVSLTYTAVFSIFLSRFDVANLPVVWLMAGGLLLVTGRAHVQLNNLQRKGNFLRFSMGLMLLLVLLMYFLSGNFNYFLSLALMLAVYRVLYLLVTLEMWTLSSLLFDAWNSKRIVNWIKVGDMPGRMLGFMAVPACLFFISVKALFLVAFCSLALAYLVLRQLLKKTEFQPYNAKTRNHFQFKDEVTILKKFFKNRLILSLALLAFVIGFVSIFHEFLLLGILQETFGSAEGIAHFFSLFYSTTLLLAILSKMLVGAKLVKTLGLNNVILLLPAALLGLSTLLGLMIFYGNTPWIFAVGAVVVFYTWYKQGFYDAVFIALLQPILQRYKIEGYVILQGLVIPLSTMAAAFALYLLYHWHGTIAWHEVGYMYIGALLIWVVTVVALKNNFLRILQNAVEVRYIDGSSVTLKDRSVIQVLEQKMQSKHTEEVIYAAELLQKLNLGLFEEQFSCLLEHSKEDVVLYGLAKMQTLRLTSGKEVLASLVKAAPTQKIQESAIRAWGVLYPEAISLILPFIESDAPELKRASIFSVMAHGKGPEVKEARARFEELVFSGQEADLVLFCELVGLLKEEAYIAPVIAFMHAPNHAVTLAAIAATSHFQHPRFLPELLQLVRTSHYHYEAMRAMAAYGDQAIDFIGSYLSEIGEDKILFVARLCKVCGQIGGAKAMEVLWWVLKYPWPELQSEAFHALKFIGFQANTKEQCYRVNERMEGIFHVIYWLFNATELLRGQKRYYLLYHALMQELEERKKHLWALLFFLFAEAPESYRKVEKAILSLERDEKWVALEMLDEKLRNITCEKLYIVLGPQHQKLKIRNLSAYYSNYQLDQITIALDVLRGKDRTGRFTVWSQATALYALAGNFYPSMLKTFVPYLFSNQPILADTALYTLLQFCEEQYYDLAVLLREALDEVKIEIIMKRRNDILNTLLEIEKVIILKSTSLFATTPDSVITDLAQIVKEERVSQGEVIFRKGDMGNCMYVIYEGEVKIHIQDYRLATLINRDFFGDLGLLDTNPRSATATAERDTLLLRIDQADFYELMAQRPEVAKGIIQVLCKRIRAQDVLITELQANQKV